MRFLPLKDLHHLTIKFKFVKQAHNICKISDSIHQNLYLRKGMGTDRKKGNDGYHC